MWQQETFSRRLTSLLNSSARCLFVASVPSWAPNGWSTVGPALTLTVAGRGAISERWVVAAHLPESAWLTSRLAAVQNREATGRCLWPQSSAAGVSDNGKPVARIRRFRLFFHPGGWLWGFLLILSTIYGIRQRFKKCTKAIVFQCVLTDRPSVWDGPSGRAV